MIVRVVSGQGVLCDRQTLTDEHQRPVATIHARCAPVSGDWGAIRSHTPLAQTWLALDAPKFGQAGTSIPASLECDTIATICGGAYSQNKIRAKQQRRCSLHWLPVR
ncbi:hypothetical protein [Actinomadura chokoriensis]|uniref:hypothetical protein n=1 Tax=Actinomadura chokoriensis TaxID=454156 RepID=UPI0031F7562A